MTNLLDETIAAIKDSGHAEADIVFIGSEKTGHQCTWDQFCVLANVEYDAGFGGQKVAHDLIIVFSDGQKMWRGEYDGSEWWEYSTLFKRPEAAISIPSLFCHGWSDLAEIARRHAGGTHG